MHGVLRGFATGLLSLRPLMAATERHVRRRENRSRRLTRTEQLTARASAAALAAREPVPGAIIDFRSVTKLYQGGDIGIDGVTFAVHPGEFVFVVGASGSGKSTTIRLLIKEAEPTSGSISVAGRDLSTIPRRRVPYYRRNIGVVFQDYKLLPDRTVYDNVAYALQVTGSGRREIREKVPDILRLTGLATKLHNRPGQLSGGEQQRVAIARALVGEPRLLLADEPTGNLDTASGREVMAILDDLVVDRGVAVVVVTHDLEVADLARRRIRVRDGLLE
jgi:cell division transport system ATP-binding protein